MFDPHATSSSSSRRRESSCIVSAGGHVTNEPDGLRALRRLAAIVSGSQDAILAKDLDGVITDWNPAAERLFGHTADEAIGRPVWSIIIPPERAEEERVLLRRALADDPVQGVLTERLRRDGSRVQVSLTMAPIRDEGGRAIGVSTTARDVTESLRADAERTRLAAIVRSTSDAVVAMDLEGRITDFNTAAADMFGLTDDSIGTSVLDAVGADESARARRADIVRRAGAGETLAYEAARLDGAGREFVLANTIGPIHDDDGEITGIAAIARDITEQRKAQEQQRWLAAVVDSSRDAIIGLGLDGTIVSWNPAAARTFGWTDEEAIGRPGRDMFVKEERWRRHAELMRGIAAGDAFEDEAERGRRRDGSTFAATVTGFPVRDADGSVHAAAFIVRDVTEQRRLEEQLEQARRMEAVGRLAGGVAHDFNNLLTVISGYAALLRAEDDGDSTELEEIDRAARRATELTGQLLAFSRQRSANPALIDLAGVLDGVMPMLGRLIGEHIAISVTHHGRLEPVLADAGQMEQVIVNLATNARDAMPDGGTLTMETRMLDLEQPVVCLTVTDTGGGIDPEVVDHVFEPFYTTKEQGRGTGLGLATAHGIVTQAGGRIHVYSEPGLGATFRVLVPAADGAATPVSDAPPEPDELEGTETVLLCEDEEALRFMVGRILGDAGYTVLSAPGGAEALEIVAGLDEPVDALVTDVIMPGLSGPEVADRIVVDGRPRTLFLSGYTADALRDRANLPPGSAFLEKPFAPASLLRALRTLLDGD
jgi:two-component system, cell cycle sensor histidine kinase and response regulator CckA